MYALLFLLPQTNPKTIPGIGIAFSLQPQPDRAAGIAGYIKIVSTPTDGFAVFRYYIQFFVPSFGIKMIQYDLPHTPAHVRQSKSVAPHFSVVIDRRNKSKAIAPGSIGQGPYLISARYNIYLRVVQMHFYFLPF